MWITSSTAKVLKPSAIALGNFDGIHRGHQKVLRPILPPAIAKIAESRKIYSTVVSFKPHPRQFFTGQTRKLLTPIREKVKILEELGVEQLVLLPFDREMAALTPSEFVAEILIAQLEAVKISVGQDFRFGRDRSGNVNILQELAANFGIDTEIATLLQNDLEEVRISSSLIRDALAKGQIDRVSLMLGRDYTLVGEVVSGQKLGRTIGFPTANLKLPESKLLPRYGVYSVKVFINDNPNYLKGVTNIGCRPTVDNSNLPTTEVHLLDWQGDLYGKTIAVHLQKFLRSQQKFSSLDALKQQIAADCQAARATID